MNKIAIPKNEYRQLRRQSIAYRKLVGKIFESVLQDPVQEIVEDFRATDLYTKEFLRDLKSGLRKSSLGKK